MAAHHGICHDVWVISIITAFIVTIDFSKTAVGAVLSQEQNGVERFLGVKGRKCRPYESNYHSSNFIIF